MRQVSTILADVTYRADMRRRAPGGPWVVVVAYHQAIAVDQLSAATVRVILERLQVETRRHCLAHDVTLLEHPEVCQLGHHGDDFTRNVARLLIETRGLNRRTPNPFPELVLFPRLERLVAALRSLRRFRRARAWRNLAVDARWRLWTSPRHRVARWRRRRRLDRRMARAGLPVIRTEPATGRPSVLAGPDVQWEGLGVRKAPPPRPGEIPPGLLGVPIIECPAIRPGAVHLVNPGQPCPGCGEVHR